MLFLKKLSNSGDDYKDIQTNTDKPSEIKNVYIGEIFFFFY